jgi:DNA processing protein
VNLTMDPGTFDLLTLALLPELGPAKQRRLLARGPVSDCLARPEDHADLFCEAARQALANGEARRETARQAARARTAGVRIVGLDEPEYPDGVRRIADPPPVLWVRGRLAAGECERSVAVVGRRGASGPGCLLARQLGRDLCAAGLTVVSGLARGIDGEAHQGALLAGRTVAVLGCGVDTVYPPEHHQLAAAIAAEGAVVSEFPLGTRPWPGNFPRRNRVIAGWGRGVVVVEAGVRSGALVTARLALDEGREVMAVPGHPLHTGAAGTNALIREGATLVRDANDVLRDLDLQPHPPKIVDPGKEDPVLEALRSGVATLEDLESATRWSASALLAHLTELELLGCVRRLPGALFAREEQGPGGSQP